MRYSKVKGRINGSFRIASSPPSRFSSVADANSSLVSLRPTVMSAVRSATMLRLLLGLCDTRP